ncbi:unnamed protein product, partial [marine sediment metagenome]
MRPTEKIKRLFVKSNVTVSSEVDDEMIRDAFLAFKKYKKNSAAIQPNIWRIIMKSRITVFAAAAVIIIAVLVTINQFGSSLDRASIAFASTLETMKRMPWMHVITESDTPRGKERSEGWI